VNRNNLSEKLTGHLRSLSSWDFKLALGIVTMLTTISSFHVVYSSGYLNGQEALALSLSNIHPPGIYTNFDFSHWLNAIHIWIAVGLIIATLGLWSRKAAGFLISLIALLWVCFVYLWWYRETLHFLKNIEVTEYTKLHDPFFKQLGMLRGASQLDVLVLLVCVALVLWQLRTLLGIRKSSQSELTL